MNTNTTKTKWKTWHKVAIGLMLLVFFGIGKLVSTAESAAVSTPALKEAETREQVVSKAFSAWDGSHKNLVTYVEANINDPKSFEHVETRYWDNKSDTIIIKMTYRAKNAFNATVTEMVRAEADLKGNLLTVTPENE